MTHRAMACNVSGCTGLPCSVAASWVCTFHSDSVLPPAARGSLAHPVHVSEWVCWALPWLHSRTPCAGYHDLWKAVLSVCELMGAAAPVLFGATHFVAWHILSSLWATHAQHRGGTCPNPRFEWS